MYGRARLSGPAALLSRELYDIDVMFSMIFIVLIHTARYYIFHIKVCYSVMQKSSPKPRQPQTPKQVDPRAWP